MDESAGLVYLSGSKDGCTEKHLYRCLLDPDAGASDADGDGGIGSIMKLTSSSGWHNCYVGVAANVFVDAFSSVSQSPSLTLYRLPSIERTSGGSSSSDARSTDPLKLQEIIRAVGKSIREVEIAESLRDPFFFRVVRKLTLAVDSSFLTCKHTVAHDLPQGRCSSCRTPVLCLSARSTRLRERPLPHHRLRLRRASRPESHQPVGHQSRPPVSFSAAFVSLKYSLIELCGLY